MRVYHDMPHYYATIEGVGTPLLSRYWGKKSDMLLVYTEP